MGWISALLCYLLFDWCHSWVANVLQPFYVIEAIKHFTITGDISSTVKVSQLLLGVSLTWNISDSPGKSLHSVAFINRSRGCIISTNCGSNFGSLLLGMCDYYFTSEFLLGRF